MTSYAKCIDKTEANQGVKFTALVGSGGVTAGDPVKWSGTAKTVVTSTTTSDVIVGIARDTIAENSSVCVLGDGCLVLTPFTLTVGGKVGVGTSGTAGDLVDYSTGTLVGTVETAGTLASVVRVQIQY